MSVCWESNSVNVVTPKTIITNTIHEVSPVRGLMANTKRTHGKEENGVTSYGATASSSVRRKMVRTLLRMALLGGFLVPHVDAYTVIALQAGTPESVEQAFLASTTNYFDATIFVNPLAPNTYQLTLKGAKSSPIPTATAFDAACALCWGGGMYRERLDDLNLIGGMYAQDALNNTCAGTPISFSTSTVCVSTATANFDCLSVYTQITSTITLRNGTVTPFPTGQFLAP